MNETTYAQRAYEHYAQLCQQVGLMPKPFTGSTFHPNLTFNKVIETSQAFPESQSVTMLEALTPVRVQFFHQIEFPAGVALSTKRIGSVAFAAHVHEQLSLKPSSQDIRQTWLASKKELTPDKLLISSPLKHLIRLLCDLRNQNVNAAVTELLASLQPMPPLSLQSSNELRKDARNTRSVPQASELTEALKQQRQLLQINKELSSNSSDPETDESSDTAADQIKLSLTPHLHLYFSGETAALTTFVLPLHFQFDHCLAEARISITEASSVMRLTVNRNDETNQLELPLTCSLIQELQNRQLQLPRKVITALQAAQSAAYIPFEPKATQQEAS